MPEFTRFSPFGHPVTGSTQASPVDRVPGGHLTHLVCPFRGCAVPFRHFKHSELPARGAKVPLKQLRQASPSVSSPPKSISFCLKNPAGHFLHLPVAVLAHPSSQTQRRPPKASTSFVIEKSCVVSPRGHRLHFVSTPPLLNVFFLQSSHLFFLLL